MDLETILGNFDAIVELPNGIEQVRWQNINLALFKGWDLVPLKELVSCNLHGGTPSRSNPQYWNGEIPWISTKNLDGSKYITTSDQFITETALQKENISLIPIDYLILSVRMNLGKIAINKVPVVINQDLRALSFQSNVLIDYLYIFFLSSNLEGSGSTVKGIQNKNLLKLLIPVPPINEQEMIIEKTEKIKLLCDRAQQAKQARDELYKKLASTKILA